jgi:hypothetical protein
VLIGSGTNVQTSRSVAGGTTKEGTRSRMVLAPTDAEGLAAPAIMAATSKAGTRDVSIGRMLAARP